MDTLQILQSLTPGAEVQLYSNAMAIQIGKTGLGIAALLCAVAATYYGLCAIGLLGSEKRTAFAIGTLCVAGIAAFFLYQKYTAFNALDDSKPILSITKMNLDYDVRRNGWTIPWTGISAIELNTQTTRKKQSTDDTTYEIRVHVKQGAAVNWKYEAAPENDMASVKEQYQTNGYLILDPEPLGLSHDVLQKALEKYRAGL